mgnify:CR=1 FL=1
MSFQLDPEFVRAISKACADMIIDGELELVPDIWNVETIGKVEVVDVQTVDIDLEALASSELGWADPLGQLKQFISDIFNSVVSWLAENIGGTVKGFIDWLWGKISPSLDSIASWIDEATSQLTNLGSVFTGFVNAILKFPEWFPTWFYDNIAKPISDILLVIPQKIWDLLPDWLKSAIKGIADAITNIPNIIDAIKGIPKAISDLISSLENFFKDPVGTLKSALEGLAESIWNLLPDWLKGAIEGLKDAWNTFVEGLKDFLEDPAGFIKARFQELSTWIWEYLPDEIKNALTGIPDAINSLITSLENFFKDPVGNLKTALGYLAEQIWNLLPEWAKNAIEGIQDSINALKTGLEEFIKDPLGTIKEAIEGLSQKLWDLLPEWLKGAITGLQDAWNTFVTGLQDFLQDPARFIKARLEEFGTFLWEHLPDWLRGAIEGLQNAWNTFVTGLQEFIKDPVGFIRARFEELSRWIWEHLPDWLRTSLERLGEFFSGIAEGVTKFVSDPVGWFQTYILPTLEQIGTRVWNLIRGAFKGFVDITGSIITETWEAILNFGKAIVNVISSGVKEIISFGKSLAEGLASIILAPIQEMLKSVGTSLEGWAKGMLKKIEEGRVEGEYIELLGMMSMLLSSQIVFRVMAQALLWLGEATSDIKIAPTVAITIVGTGQRTTVEIPVKLGNILKHLASEFREYPDVLLRGVVRGISIWFSQPVARLLNYGWRNAVPVELPPLSGIIEYTRRMLPHEEFEKVFNTSKWFLRLYGYSDTVVDQYLSLEKDLYITVTDRFGKERKVPLALIYELPSPSDVATMMVRDIFATPEDFKKLYLARGMAEDIGALYYFLRFRYPPPEVLWKFTTRGISGLLWLHVPEDEIEKIMETEGEAMGVKTPPVPPVTLNFANKELLTAFKIYMKWHDYSRISWFDKDKHGFAFASDNMIYIDTLADIPSKIDQRWMTRFGIYEFLREKGVTRESPVSEFRTKTVERESTSNIVLDLTNFCRTLQATGLHPDWVPITAVAETINSIADERTLMRTGVLNLFKEGFWDIKSVEAVLGGVIITSFKVSYFDLEKMGWDDGYINIPLRYLPPERKLIELRALMDRALDILREIQRDISTAYQEFILEDYNAFKERLSSVITSINEVFANDFEAITGTQLPEDLKLKFVEEYYKPYIEALKTYRDVFTTRRIRSWVYRILGWVIYRTAYGYVTEEDAMKVAKTLSDIAKLPAKEASAIEEILREMVGIAQREYQREYIPTPLTLATMSEYIPAVRMFANRVFEAKGVPQEWRSIWLQYIDIRAIVDEVREVQSSVERLYEYFMINTDMFASFLEVLKPYGYEDRELKLITDRANLDRWYRAYRELVGTPRELVTMAEYSPLARRLALAEVKKRIDALPIEQEAKEFLYKLWEDYIRIRPVYDEVEREVTELITDYARGALTWEQFNTLLEELKDWGIDEWEADAIRFLAMMRRRRYELTGYVVTLEEAQEEAQA